MKFRKKPVVIEAHRYDGAEWALMRWVEGTQKTGRFRFDGTGAVYVETLEGEMRGDVGDWIICGVKGEFYPCKPDIFAATYEAVEG
jgi:hypothetical protein